MKIVNIDKLKFIGNQGQVYQQRQTLFWEEKMGEYFFSEENKTG